MATWLRQSTAVDVALGPFVDSTDGFTPETGLSLTQAECRLKKNNGAWAQKNDNTTGTHEEEGWYELELDATDTNTLGILMLAVYVTGALPCWREFLVVPANVYDSLILDTDALETDVTQWLGSAAATPTVAGVPEVDVTHWLGTAAATPSVAGVPEVDVTHAAGTSVQAANGRFETNVEQVEGTDATDYFATLDDAVLAAIAGLPTPPSAAVIADAVWDEDATAHQTQGTFGQAIGDPVADTDTIFGLVNSISAAVTALAAAVAAIDVPTAEENADELLDHTDGVEGNLTLRQHCRLAAAALYGISITSGGNRVYRNTGNNIDRITATVNNGDRSVVVLDKS